MKLIPFSTLSDFKIVFDHHLHQETAAKRLIALRQGSYSVAEFSIEFCIAEQATNLRQEGIFQMLFLIESKINFPLEMNLRTLMI